MQDPQPAATGRLENWQRLAELLRASGAGAGVTRISTGTASATAANDTAGLSVLDALRSEDIAGSGEQHAAGEQLHARLNGLLHQLSVFELVSHCPVVAITGLLNAGKSSLLATYLSEAGRARVLRGVGNQQGTHRFVIWMPQLWWSDSELLSTLISYLTSVFGHPPEQLSSDVEVAQQQYNGQIIAASLLTSSPGSQSATDVAIAQDPLAVPLIASDPALNELKLGLIDCPDIQTGFLDHPTNELRGDELAASRRSQLAKIGRLCSAFLVVSKLSSLHDDGLLQLLTTLRDAMPGVPRILAINKVKSRYAPDVVLEEARGLVDRFGIASVFAAYDFRSAISLARIPKTPPGLVSTEAQPQPVFFDVASYREAAKDQGPTATGQPVTLPNRDYLFHLSTRLEAGNLAKESHRSLTIQLQAIASEAIEWLQRNEGLRKRQLNSAWQAIADACYDFMAERNSEGHSTGLRLQASPAIIGQLADSFQRTAPVWMRFSMTIDRTARQFQQAISNSASRFKILQSASNTVTQFAKSFRRGEGAQVVTPQRLADAIRNYDYQDALRRVGDEHLVAGSEVAIKRFAAEDKSLLDPQELDAWSQQIWNNMPLKQKLWKGTQPLALLMAPLLAVVLVPIDGGGTAVLVFASMKELLAAAGIAALLGPIVVGDGALQIVHRETPWRQLSDLFALVCDSLGVPRPPPDQLPVSSCAGEPRSLLPCSIPVKSIPVKTSDNAAKQLTQTLSQSNHFALAQWQTPDDFFRSLRIAIRDCV